MTDRLRPRPDRAKIGMDRLRTELRQISTKELRATVDALVGAAGVELVTVTGPDANDFWKIVEIDGGDSLIVQQWDDSASAFLERLEIVGKGTGLTDEGDFILYDLDGAEIFRWDESANVVAIKRELIFDAPFNIHSVRYASRSGPDTGDEWLMAETDSADSWTVQQFDSSAASLIDRFKIIGKGTAVTDEGDMIFYDLDGAEIFRFDESLDRLQFAAGRGRIDFAGGSSILSSIERILSFGADIAIEAESTGSSAQDIRLKADDAAGVSRTRMQVHGADDISFFKVDGTTVSLLWDESDNRWEFAVPPLGIGGGSHDLFSASHPDVTFADTPADNELLQFDSGSGEWSAEPASAHGSHGGASGSSHFEYVEIGSLATKTGTLRWYPPFDITLTDVTINVPVQPTGASILVDVNKNGTTVFTTQSNRPTIAISTNFDKSGTPNITALSKDSDYITVDIDQVGSTVPGSDMTIQIRYDVV